MSGPVPTNASGKVPKKPKIKHMASVCGICGGAFEPRVAHYHLVSQSAVSDRIKRVHPMWEQADEACPPCVESVMTVRRPALRLPFLSFLIGR